MHDLSNPLTYMLACVCAFLLSLGFEKVVPKCMLFLPAGTSDLLGRKFDIQLNELP